MPHPLFAAEEEIVPASAPSRRDIALQQHASMQVASEAVANLAPRTTTPAPPPPPAITRRKPEGFRLGQDFEATTKEIRVSHWAKTTIACVYDGSGATLDLASAPRAERPHLPTPPGKLRGTWQGRLSECMEEEPFAEAEPEPATFMHGSTDLARPESAKVDDDADHDDDDRSYSMSYDEGGEESDIEDFFSCHDENGIEHMEEDHVDHEDHEDDAGSVHGDGKRDTGFGTDGSVLAATRELVEEMM
ncbi:hypothetical protein CYMTET_30679, partial [Cymbomonas tetramitiformis]